VLRDPSIVRRRTQPRQFRGQTIEMEIPYFDVDGEQVWGATAMVLAEFLAVLESAP